MRLTVPASLVLSGMLSTVSLFGITGPVQPALAVDCTPTATTTWVGDGTDGSVVGTTYTVVKFATAGSCTWTVPFGVTSITALAVGGGGGGGGGSGTYAVSSSTSDSGGAGSGGGGGNIVTGSGSVTGGQSLSIVVGAGGARGGGASWGSPGGCGTNGSSSSISDISLSASGGNGGLGGGQDDTCTGERRAGNSYFLAGPGGNSGSGMTGGAASGHQAGQGASDSSNGGAATAVVTGTTIAFAGVSGSYSDGGGGGASAAYGSRSSTKPGSGGGGGREPLYIPGPYSGDYYYGYNGTAGIDGIVILRFQPLTVTASSPSAITLGGAVPIVTYSSNPSTTDEDWATPPTCGVYAADDLTTPLTSLTTAGTYVTRCTGGVLASGAAMVSVDGTLTVNPLVIKASSPDPMKMGGSTPAITFTVDPEGATPDWETEPTCGVYASGNLSTPLTRITEPGTYVTHCTGGELSNGATAFIFEDGTFIVEAALPDTGLMWMTLVGIGVLSGVFYFLGGGAFGARARLRFAGIDRQVSQKMADIGASFERMDLMSKRRQQRDRIRKRRG